MFVVNLILLFPLQ